MELDNNITPNENDENIQNGENSQNPEGNQQKSEEDWEKRFKDTQSAFTKAQQEKVEIAKLLVEKDPSAVERISDEKVRKKILQDKWDVNSLEELKIVHPDYNKTEDDEEEELSKFEQLEREVKLMKFYQTKTKLNEAIENIELQHKDVITTIPNFKDKLNDELKNISESLSPKERVEKAFKLVANSNISSANVYSIMQGVSGITTTKNTETKEDLNETPLAKKLKEFQ